MPNSRRSRRKPTSVASSSKKPRAVCANKQRQELIYRASSSTSRSRFAPEGNETPVFRRQWFSEDVDCEDGTQLSSEDTVMAQLPQYRKYFTNLNDPSDDSFDWHPKCYPSVEMEYPNTNSSERFILLAPTDQFGYNPILDLEQTIYTIIKHYLTPAQQTLFGPIPKDASIGSELDDPPTNHLCAVKRAILQRDGPSFFKAVTNINKLLRALKYPLLPNQPNSLKQNIALWTDTPLPTEVLMRIMEETYQRSVGPHVKNLKTHGTSPDAVYGELMPSLAHKIIHFTKLKEDSLFLDLGSGVGNVVVQASLQTGCHSYGIELNPKPAKIGKTMVGNFKTRCRMWGIKVGKIELEEGNMLESPRVDDLIRKADVVLVNNKVFTPALNEQLRSKFLDLKEGAYIVSLAPFVQALNVRLTERNVSDSGQIFVASKHQYLSGDISWCSSGGPYYIHCVDRAGYAEVCTRFENEREKHRRS
ncbi:S-adenosyl-L-methionine-dependent methyltransferase [Mycena leptocephala]|nr:S-adenosyl-L-methionine-dependent methyltransferase [Mycena leptocephala]